MSGSVYIIQMDNTDKFKIGVSVNVNSRLSSLQTGNPHALSIYHSYECINYKSIEPIMHTHFANDRISGEWFVLDNDKLKECIAKIHEIGVLDKTQSAAVATSNVIAKPVTKPVAKLKKHLCTDCKYVTNNLANFNKHKLTNKHIEKVAELKKILQTTPHMVCKFCNNAFSHASSLSRHRKICGMKKNADNKIISLTDDIVNLKNAMTIMQQKIDTVNSDKESFKRIAEGIIETNLLNSTISAQS